MYKNLNEMLSKREMKMFKAFCETQLIALSEGADFDYISFEYDGIDILNPFVDECDWYEVDPIEYYGELFLNSKFMDLLNE